MPGSVKLIDVMRGDPINRFLISGEGNALRAMMVNSLMEGHMNVENMHYQNMDRDIEEYGRVTHNTNNIVPVNTGPELTMAQKQHQILNSHSEWKVCIFLYIFVSNAHIYMHTYTHVYIYNYIGTIRE